MAEKMLDAQGYMQKILLARIYDLLKVTPCSIWTLCPID